MQICLVTYPTANEFDRNRIDQSRTLQELTNRPSLGILTLAAVLEKLGHQIKVVDLNQLYLSFSSDLSNSFADYAAHHLSNIAADNYGFSSICSSYPLTIRITRLLNQYRNDSSIILGGPQASIVDLQTLEAFPWIDTIVRGEGEESLPQLLEAIYKCESFGDIPNITYREGSKIIRSPMQRLITDLDSIPIPAFHLHPLDKVNTIPLEIGRGCPYNCKFCSTSEFFGRQYRLKSPKRILKEVQILSKRHSIDRFSFSHDMFTANRAKVIEICDEFISANLPDITWACSARIDTVDDALMEHMAEAGCRGIFFGVETGSPKIQREINKNLDLSKVVPRIKCANDLGMAATASFITGFPNETRDDLCQTINVILDLARLDDTKPQITMLAPMPGTPYYQEFIDVLELDEVFSAMSFQGHHHEQEDYDLIAQHPKVFSEFYGIPTTHLSRSFLSELVHFVMTTIRKIRMPALLLHQNAGGFVKVFERWQEWRRDQGIETGRHTEDRLDYYTKDDFVLHFVEFARNNYAHLFSGKPEVLETILSYEEAKIAYARDGCPDNSKDDQEDVEWQLSDHAIPRIKENIHFVKLPADYESIGERLKNKSPLDNITENEVFVTYQIGPEGQVEIKQLPGLASYLIILCDGKSSVSQITHEFIKNISSREVDLKGINPDIACLVGLDSLYEQGFLSMQ